jgi:hypothetical protein
MVANSSGIGRHGLACIDIDVERSMYIDLDVERSMYIDIDLHRRMQVEFDWRSVS